MKTVLLGVSHWHAPMHAHALVAAGAQVVGASDPNSQCLPAFSQQFNLEVFTSHHEMLHKLKPEFAVVMGTPQQMPAYARDLIDAGIPCLIEKPLSTNAAGVASLMAKAVSANAFVAIAMANRYSGVWPALQGYRPLQMHFRMVNGSPQRYVQDGVDWVLDPAIGGGGALRNLGIHGVDAFCLMAQQQPIEVIGSLLSRTMHHQAVEDHALVSLQAGDLWGTVEAGYTYPTLAAGGDYSFRVVSGNLWLQESEDLQAVTYEHQRQLPTVSLAHRYKALAKDTLNRLQAGLPPAAGLADLWRAMQVIDRAYQVAQWV